MKLFTKSFLLILSMLVFAACSSEDDANTNTPEEQEEQEEVANETFVRITASSSISTTPFTTTRETIVYNDYLYTVADVNTYRYDFSAGSWETTNTESENIANVPYFSYNVSFLRDNKWYILREQSLSAYDFSTNTWEQVAQFSFDSTLTSPIGVYDSNELYVFSDIFDTVYTFNFETNTLETHATFEQRPNTGQLVKSVYKVGADYYFTKVKNYETLEIYKWKDNFTTFELLNEYTTDYIAQGVGFVFEDYILFGLGGEASADADGNLTNFDLSNKFYSYNVVEDEFKEVDNTFYQGCYIPIPAQYEDKYYLLGGVTIENDDTMRRQTLDIINFEIVN